MGKEGDGERKGKERKKGYFKEFKRTHRKYAFSCNIGFP